MNMPPRRTSSDRMHRWKYDRAVALVVACALGQVPAAAAAPTHVRLTTPAGPVHVWIPDGIELAADSTTDPAAAPATGPATAPAVAPGTPGVVVYVHGYFADVDRAWREHRLAEQFAASGVAAVFIACEAPRGASQPVHWPRLAPLLDAVARGIGRPLPAGRVVAVGHSGAHRTLSSWLDDPRLATIVLVDALYGDKPQFREWLLADPDRRLIDAAAQTQAWSDALHATIPDALVFDGFPRAVRLNGARSARVVYVRSQLEHMQLVADGIALPMLLRALRLPEAASSVSRSGRPRTDS